MKQLLPILCLLILASSCSIKPVCKLKNRVYDSKHNLKLDVYAPRKIKSPKKVLVFVHGGNWIRGKKSIYKFFGKGMARKDVICVVVGYRLSPGANINDMATDVAQSIKWIKENAGKIKADTTNIFVSGHSAGGHIAAMMATNDIYFVKLNIQNPVKGSILIDAFGLDMYSYLTLSKNPKDSIYIPTFTNEPVNWKKYSPVYHLKKETPPFLIFVGGKTYPIIKIQNAEFYKTLLKFQPAAKVIEIKRKKHIPMIFQFYNPRAKPYRYILDFMEVKKN